MLAKVSSSILTAGFFQLTKFCSELPILSNNMLFLLYIRLIHLPFNRDRQHQFVFPEERTLNESVSFCGRFNSTVTVPATADDNQHLADQLVLFNDVCAPTSTWKLWLGITDEVEDGVWRDLATDQLAPYLNFPPLNAGSSYTCASMKADGFWDGDRCIHKRCTACYMDKSDFLYLRGLCFDKAFQMRFRVQDYIDGRPFFRGYYNMLILWSSSPKRWLLIDTTTNATLLRTVYVSKGKYPVGRHTWEVVTELCTKTEGEHVLLSLAPCPDHLFTCNSGNCIQSHLRCNLRYDCRDGSDEVDCWVIEMVDQLQSELPPTGPGSSSLSVTPSITLTRIANVDDINMAITLEFWLVLTWTDDRLVLRHLNEKKNGTILSVRDADRVWRPRYQLVNLEGGQKQLLSQNLVIKTSLNATMPDFNNVDMGKPIRPY